MLEQRLLCNHKDGPKGTVFLDLSDFIFNQAGLIDRQRLGPFLEQPVESVENTRIAQVSIFNHRPVSFTHSLHQHGVNPFKLRLLVFVKL